MDAPFHRVQAVLQPARYGGDAVVQPFLQDGFQVFLRRAVVRAHHHQIHGNVAFQSGLRHQCVHEMLRFDAAGFRFENQADGVFAVAVVAHFFNQIQHELFGVDLVLAQLLFAGFGLGIGLLFDFGQDFGGRCVGRQLRYDDAPLPARHFVDFVPRTHAQAAFAGFVYLLHVFGRRDDVSAAGKIGRGDVCHQICRAQIRIFQQGDGGLGDFGQVVGRDFGGHAHGNAAGAVEQHHGQACGQQHGFFLRAVIIGHEIDCALLDFAQ